MNENENFCKAIEQAVVLPCAKEMQLISDEKCCSPRKIRKTQKCGITRNWHRKPTKVAQMRRFEYAKS